MINIKLKNLEIDLGGHCKINCSFCSLRDHNIQHRKKPKQLSINEIEDLISQACDLGVKKVILYSNREKHSDTNKILKLLDQNKITAKFFQNKDDNSIYINCLKHKNSCYITLDGNVQPCVGMNLSIGNIRNNSLKSILNDSEVIENLKNHQIMLKGPCRECEQFSNCYGCRARAYALTGDYLASDPQCPNNQNKLDRITHLPMSVENLIPQKDGMQVVSELLKVGERYAKVSSILSDKSPFIKEDKSLEDVVYMEIMAQSAAAMNGFEKFDTAKTDYGGFLIGGQKINIYTKTYAGQKLIIDIFKTTKFGNFGILMATIKHKNKLVAEGEVKIYQNDRPNNNGAENEL